MAVTPIPEAQHEVNFRADPALQLRPLSNFLQRNFTPSTPHTRGIAQRGVHVPARDTLHNARARLG